MYGYNEIEEVSKFGLNQKVYLSKFELVAVENVSGMCLDINYNVDGKNYMNRVFPVNRVWKGKEEILDKTSAEYKVEAAKAAKMISATLISIVKCFVSEDKIKTALKVPLNSFEDYAIILENLIKSNTMWDAEELDIFLEYQKKPSKNQTRTFLCVPSDIRQGEFICKAQKGVFTETKVGKDLAYVNEQGTLHPFKRSKWFLDSPYANLTDFGKKEEEPTSETVSEDVPLW